MRSWVPSSAQSKKDRKGERKGRGEEWREKATETKYYEIYRYIYQRYSVDKSRSSPGMVLHTCNPSPPETELAGSQVQDHFRCIVRVVKNRRSHDSTFA